MRSLLLAAPLAFALGCPNGPPPVDGPTDLRIDIPEPPAEGEGMQFISPDMVIPTGTERMLCWTSDFIPEGDLFATKFQGFQASTGGHHVLSFRSTIPRAPGEVFDCTDPASMATVEPLVLPDPPGIKILPDGFAVRIPAGSTLVMQSHYVNYTDKDILVRDVAHIELQPAGVDFQEVSYLVVNSLDFDLLPGEERSGGHGCEMPGEMNLLALDGHMHELGTKFHIDLTRVGAEAERIYDIPVWDSAMRDLPPLQKWQPGEMTLNAGDRLDMECTWNNTRDHNVRFPEEMCAMVSYYYPPIIPAGEDDGVIICTN